jgi:hypothetical protein
VESEAQHLGRLTPGNPAFPVAFNDEHFPGTGLGRSQKSQASQP